MSLSHPVLSALLPVLLLIGIGFAAGRLRLIRGEAVRDLSNLVFLVLVQALLFRTMVTADLARLNLRSVALYLYSKWWPGRCSLRCCWRGG